MMLDPNLSTLIITQQQQRYSYISLAQIDRQVTADNPGSIQQSNSLHISPGFPELFKKQECVGVRKAKLKLKAFSPYSGIID